MKKLWKQVDGLLRGRETFSSEEALLQVRTAVCVINGHKPSTPEHVPGMDFSVCVCRHPNGVDASSIHWRAQYAGAVFSPWRMGKRVHGFVAVILEYVRFLTDAARGVFSCL